MTGSIIYLAQGPSDRPAFLDLPAALGRVRAETIYDLATLDLGDCRGLLISMHADQRHLARCQDVLESYMDRGGTIVFNGHVAHFFLPDLRRFVPLDKPGPKDLAVIRVAAHPVFEGVEEGDMLFRRGVAGFYGRGHNPPPPGSVVLNRLAGDKAPIDWLWPRPRGGVLLAHGGNDLWMYARENSTVSRIATQLLDWLETRPAPSERLSA